MVIIQVHLTTKGKFYTLYLLGAKMISTHISRSHILVLSGTKIVSHMFKFYFRSGTEVPVLLTSLLETDKKRLRDVKDTEWRGKREWVDLHFDQWGGTGVENEGVWNDTKGRVRFLSELKAEQTLLTGLSTHRWAWLQLNQHQIPSPQTRYTQTHSQSHRNVILHHISHSVYMCTNTLWQTGSFFLSKQKLVVRMGSEISSTTEAKLFPLSYGAERKDSFWRMKIKPLMRKRWA